MSDESPLETSLYQYEKNIKGPTKEIDLDAPSAHKEPGVKK